MTDHRRMFAGWITFSAEREGDETVVQALVLTRANDANKIGHNSMIRSVLQTITAPIVGLAHMVRRDKTAT
jgi:hypothetical protein